MTDYNGWKNYETWCVNLWMGNDQGHQEALLTIARDLTDDDGETDLYELGHAIKHYVHELPECVDVQDQASFVSDLLGAALGEVDWPEIAEHYAADAKELLADA